MVDVSYIPLVTKGIRVFKQVIFPRSNCHSHSHAIFSIKYIKCCVVDNNLL